MVGAQVLADCLRRVRTRDTGGAFRERFMLEAVLFYVLAIAAVPLLAECASCSQKSGTAPRNHFTE